MKILVITSRYPPYHFGGYELRCRDIVETLSARGHDILVLSTIAENAAPKPHQPTRDRALRRLHVQLSPDSLLARLQRCRITHMAAMSLALLRELVVGNLDIALIDHTVHLFKPEVIYLGHVTILTRALMPYLATRPVPIVYDEGGSGLIDAWSERGIWYKYVDADPSRFPVFNRVRSAITRLIPNATRFRIKTTWGWPANMCAIFNSETNRQITIASGLPSMRSWVIHSGININAFTYRPRPSIATPAVFIVPGRIEPQKGQIDALGLLTSLRDRGVEARLILVGQRWIRDYCMKIEREIKDRRLEDWVTMIPMMTQTELVSAYHRADICFFPSYQQVGFSRIPLEAMACGCIVISYGNEGSNEIIRDTHNGFIVPPAQYGTIAEVVERLIANPRMASRVLETARNDVEKEHSLEGYVEAIERVIADAASCPEGAKPWSAGLALPSGSTHQRKYPDVQL